MLVASLFAALVLLAPFGVAPDVQDGGAPPPGPLFDDPGLRTLSDAEVAELGALPLPLGERVVYGVSYYGIPVGEASLEVARVVAAGERRLLHCVAIARTNDFFSSLYRIHDRHEALVDAADGHVVHTRTRTLHRGHEAHEEVRFDWQTHFVLEREVEFQKGREFRTDFDFGPFVYDVFDAFYALRATPGRPGFEVTLPVYASVKVRSFDVRVGERRPFVTPLLGEVEVLEVRPREPLDSESGSGVVLALADAGHLPVRLSGWFRASERFRVGGMTAELTAYRPARVPWPPDGRSWSPPPAVEVGSEGRPSWDPPAEVIAARVEAGVEARDERFEWPRPEGSADDGT